MIKESELLRRAVRWISDQRKDKPDIKLAKLIDDASMRFNLNALQQETLYRLLKNPEELPT